MVKLTIIVFISMVVTCLAASASYSPGMRKVEAKIHLTPSEEVQGFQTGEQPPEQQKKQRKPAGETFGAAGDGGTYRGYRGVSQIGFPHISIGKPIHRPGWGLGGLGLNTFGLGLGWGLGNWGLGGWHRPGGFGWLF